MNHYTILLAVFVLLLALVPTQISAGQSAAGKATLGTWGGPDLQIEVTENGATLDFDCAQGSVFEPLLLDAKGHFQVKGTFQPQLGGPVKKDQSSTSRDVEYAGAVEGDTMQLEFSPLPNRALRQRFILVRGQPGKLRRCH